MPEEKEIEQKMFKIWWRIFCNDVIFKTLKKPKTIAGWVKKRKSLMLPQISLIMFFSDV